MLAPHTLDSPLLNDSRKLWVQPAESGAASTVLIVLDAELYIDRVKAPEIIRNWRTSHRASFDCVYVSNKDSASRHLDYTCNETYADFLVVELLPWIVQNVGRHQQVFLAGLSLSGLAAVFTALRYSGVFAGALAQSPSAWWNDEWLAVSLPSTTSKPGRFWVSVGDNEIQKDIAHQPSGMLQKVTQLDSVRRLSEKLQATGDEVRHAEFHGGHDPACWAAELPAALTWLMGAEV